MNVEAKLCIDSSEVRPVKRKQILVGFFSACAMVVLILDSKTALAGAQEGVSLCLMTMIPSLFPFFLLSSALNQALLGASPRVLRPLARWLGIPEGSEGLMVTSLLGGYPAGAQSVATGYQTGNLTRQQAQRLLYLCNQPGPAFLFGIGAQLFPKLWMVWALWAIVLLSAGLTALAVPAPQTPNGAWKAGVQRSPGDILWGSLRAMGAVCGWVVVFRVILAFLERWMLWLLPSQMQVLLTGILELSNGCLALTQIDSLKLRFCLAAGLLSFGGMCVGLQTCSVAKNISGTPYFLGKCLQGAFAASAAVCVAYGIWLPLAGVFGLSLFFRRKRCGNFRAVGV